MEREMGLTMEIVPTNSTEEGCPGGVASADMEKCELLHCLCEIICITCSCLWDYVRPAWLACHCVMQRDHVEVTGWVFSSSENNLSIFGYVYSCRTKVDVAAMGTELRN